MRKRSNVTGSGIVEGKVAVTVDEAAQLLSVGRWTIYQMLSSGDLPSIKLGRSRRIPIKAIESLAYPVVEKAS